MIKRLFYLSFLISSPVFAGLKVVGPLYDANNSTGTAGQVLISTSVGVLWDTSGGGSGDVTAVGDCTTGAAFNGSCGSVLTWTTSGATIDDNGGSVLTLSNIDDIIYTAAEHAFQTGGMFVYHTGTEWYAQNSDSGIDPTALSDANVEIENVNTTTGTFSDLAFFTTDFLGTRYFGSKLSGYFNSRNIGQVGGGIYVITTNAGAPINVANFGSNGYLGVGVGTTLPAAKFEVQTNSIGASQNDIYGIALRNTTTAAAGAQQYSPPLIFEGQGWKTAATAASQSVEFRIDNQPAQGSSAPTGTLIVATSINGGAYGNVLNIASNGAVSAGSSFTASTISGQTVVHIQSKSAFRSSADGLIELTNNANTGLTRLNLGGSTSSFPALAVSATKLQAKLADNSAFTDVEVLDEAYGVGWNGSQEVPTKNAVYDKMETNAVVALSFVIDGGTSAITTGIKGDIEVPYACTINRATALADQSGSIVVDIWKDTYANFPPTDTDSITASAPVTISAATKSQDSTLTGWTTSISDGDILRYNVDSASSITLVTISLKCTK